jgi:hypothetical protein
VTFALNSALRDIREVGQHAALLPAAIFTLRRGVSGKNFHPNTLITTAPGGKVRVRAKVSICGICSTFWNTTDNRQNLAGRTLAISRPIH